jgi:hypothetical protein
MSVNDTVKRVAAPRGLRMTALLGRYDACSSVASQQCDFGGWCVVCYDS